MDVGSIDNARLGKTFVQSSSFYLLLIQGVEPEQPPKRGKLVLVTTSGFLRGITGEYTYRNCLTPFYPSLSSFPSSRVNIGHYTKNFAGVN